MKQPYEMIYHAGNLEASWWDVLWKPRRIRGASRFGVIMLHGATMAATPTEVHGPTWPYAHRLAAVLAREGIPVVAGAMTAGIGTGNTYANDGISGTAASALVNKALDRLAAGAGCSGAKAFTIGISMGGAVGVRWASLNPAKAAGHVGIIPMSDMRQTYAENPNMSAQAGSFSTGIATAWGLAFRNISDAVVNVGSPTLESVTGAFTGADVGRQIIRGYLQPAIPPDTKVLSVESPTSLTMDKNATAPGTAQLISIGAPLPLAGTAGADLPGVHAPRLASNDIPNRHYYASDDPYVPTDTVTALAAAAEGSAYNMGAHGHDNDVVAAMATHNGGSDFSDLVAWLKENGA